MIKVIYDEIPAAKQAQIVEGLKAMAVRLVAADVNGSGLVIARSDAAVVEACGGAKFAPQMLRNAFHGRQTYEHAARHILPYFQRSAWWHFRVGCRHYAGEAWAAIKRWLMGN